MMKISEHVQQFILFLIVVIGLIFSLYFAGKNIIDSIQMYNIKYSGSDTYEVIVDMSRIPSEGRRIRYSYEVLGNVHENIVPATANAWGEKSLLQDYDLLMTGAMFYALLGLILFFIMSYTLFKWFTKYKQQLN